MPNYLETIYFRDEFGEDSYLKNFATILMINILNQVRAIKSF